MEPTDPRLTFGRFLADVSARSGKQRAVVSDVGTYTYDELHDASRHLARALIGAGVAKGARVGLLMSNRPDWIIAAYAIGMLGGVIVPVNTFAEAAEQDHILRHGDVSLLLLQSRLLKHDYVGDLSARHEGLAKGTPQKLRIPELPQLRRAVCLDASERRGGIEPWSDLLAQAHDVPEALLDEVISEVEPSDDALIIYTSGTTAQPKGVVHTQRAAVLQAWRYRDFLVFDESDRVYTTYPFFWTAGIAMSIGGTFAAGGTLLIQEHFEPGAALDLIESERATSVHAWPHQHKSLGEHPSAGERDLSAIRKVDMTSPLAKLAGLRQNVYGIGASYGLSETFTIASGIPSNAPLEERRDSSGVAWPGMEICIVDPESGEPLPVGEPGEVAVRGVTLMRGYYKVLPERVLDASGFFRTQDGGSLDAQGRLHWTGRLGNLIKTGGANVSPVEIQELLESHSEVRVGIAVGVPHPTLGEVVVLCAVRTEGSALSEDDLRDWLRARLAVYKVPRRILFFAPGDLSYTGNQKVQAGPLREAALARLEEEGAVIDGYGYAPNA
jgi:acyl-CoA synthetase (AMP-forming)/AMP-acid ligase II